MDDIAILFSKLAALKKSFESLDFGKNGRALGIHIEPLFPRYTNLTKEVKDKLPELYSDLPEIELPKPMGQGGLKERYDLYYHANVIPLIKNLDYILEVRANSRVGEKIEQMEKPQRIFLTHGRSKEWYKVQSNLEKDLGYKTLELAQEANLGRTVLQKLNEESSKCSVAVIVMTGDDVMGEEIRARENVMHEIGFFQGKYGLQNVVLLHEEGVNIPSNIHGLVYISFPKDTVEAALAGLQEN